MKTLNCNYILEYYGFTVFFNQINALLNILFLKNPEKKIENVFNIDKNNKLNPISILK